MKAIVAVALLGLLVVACAETEDKKQEKDPNKYGWENYGYSEDSYSYEGHRYKSKDSSKNTHRKYGGDSPYSKVGDSPYSKGPYSTTGAYPTAEDSQGAPQAAVQQAGSAQQP